jgi:hypothetical protein
MGQQDRGNNLTVAIQNTAVRIIEEFIHFYVTKHA